MIRNGQHEIRLLFSLHTPKGLLIDISGLALVIRNWLSLLERHFWEDLVHMFAWHGSVS